MKLTPGQVRGALKLSQDAYRHWQTVLAPLAVRKGRSASFTHGDLLALGIVKSVTDQIGLPVGNLHAVARTLFDQCGQQPWTRFERLVALVFVETSALSFVPDNQIPQMTQAAIIVPCGPIIAALRTTLMVEQPEETQNALRFPLVSVAPNRGRQNT